MQRLERLEHSLDVRASSNPIDRMDDRVTDRHRPLESDIHFDRLVLSDIEVHTKSTIAS